MIALEKLLTKALKRLSAQYEMEQRQAEHIEALERQLDRLPGQVTHLPRDSPRGYAGTGDDAPAWVSARLWPEAVMLTGGAIGPFRVGMRNQIRILVLVLERPPYRPCPRRGLSVR